MNTLLEILHAGDYCSILLFVAILLWVGNKIVEQHPSIRQCGGYLAGVGFLAYGAYAWLRWPPRQANDLLAVGIGSLFAAAIVLALAWMGLPVLLLVWTTTVAALGNRIGGWFTALRTKKAARRTRLLEEQQRRREEEEYRRTAPERERARKEAEKTLQVQTQSQKRRDDARAACELFYHRHAHALGDRFPKEAFEDYVKKYLADGHPPEYVEERSRQLQEILRQHVEQVEPPKTPFTIESLADWYQTTKRLIEALPVDERYKHAQIAHLNARYAELMQAQMETLQP